MKILLRNYKDKEYVWVTAKYNGNKFVVDGTHFDEWQVVSVLNDNRKNYLKCTSCGKIFPKKGKQFAKHKELSATNAPCLSCNRLRSNVTSTERRKYIANSDGTYTIQTEVKAELYCHYSTYTSFYLNSPEAFVRCPLRQCAEAKATEIVDTFTKYPGVFDDIITVDKILDNGYKTIGYSDKNITEYILDTDIYITAYVNASGIVDSFYVDTSNYCGTLWYSKKYNTLFTENDCRYSAYCSDENNEILKFIAKLYK